MAGEEEGSGRTNNVLSQERALCLKNTNSPKTEQEKTLIQRKHPHLANLQKPLYASLTFFI